MEININFQDYTTGHEAGKFIVNPFYLEHLLNLFYQGYYSEVWQEIIDTEVNFSKSIEEITYSLIGLEFDKRL